MVCGVGMGVETGLFVLAKQYGLIGSFWSQNRVFLIAPVYRCILTHFPSFVLCLLSFLSLALLPPPLFLFFVFCFFVGFVFVFESVLRTCLSVSISPSLAPVVFHHYLSASPFPLPALCECLPALFHF